MKAGVDARDWNKAADEMIDSNYYKQLPNRAGRLVKRMRSLTWFNFFKAKQLNLICLVRKNLYQKQV